MTFLPRHLGRDPCNRIDRVVVLHDYVTPEGGAGMLALTAAREYRDAGLPVTFFTGGAGDAAAGELDGIDIVSLGRQGLLRSSAGAAMRQGLHNRGARDALAGWIARHDTPATVYHLHNWSQILSPAIFEALRTVEPRTIVTCHDFFNACPNGGFVNFAKSEPCCLRPLSVACLTMQCDRRSALHKYWRTARHLHLNRTARFASSRATFTFLHERMRDRFVEAGFAGADLRVVPNPVEPWSRERIASEANSRLLFVGRVGRDKGADIAVEAARAVGMPITIVGSGELANDLPARFAGVEMSGWCDRPGIVAAARQARALIAPSRVVEPFGLVILEAAMSGLPVLISDRAYLAEDVERDRFGVAFDPADLAALAKDVARLAHDDALVRQMSINGLTRAPAYTHSPSEWMNAFLQIFREKLADVPDIGRRQPPIATASAV